MLGAIYIFSRKGELLISRIYRQDSRANSEAFRINVISIPSSENIKPINTFDDTTFYHITFENLYFVASTTNRNVNVSMIFEFLYKLIGVLYSYFGRIDEETVKKQDVFIYEILDEMVDFGYIQNTEIGNMKHNLGSKKSIGSSLSGGKFENADWDMQQKVMASRGAVLWRRNDIIYKKNRVFIDVLESINVLVGSKGVVSKMEVEGRVIVKSYLSGIPKCTLGFNQKLLKSIPNDSEQPNKMEITDRVFHQCVEQSEGNVIKFIPPDGQFELMRYRSSGQFELPFSVLVDTTDNSKNSRTEIQVLIKSKFSEQMAANNVLLLIPTPQNTTSCEFLIQGSSFFASNVSYNSRAKFNPSQNAVIWKLYRFQGNTEYSISIKAKLLGSAKPWVGNKPPLQLYFDIPQYSLTGLQVKFMQVDCDKQYNSTKFVKNSVNAGSFLIRV